MRKNNTLIHYGIDGQKWGVRRYQNPDGTYTYVGLMRKRSNYTTRRGDIRNMSDDDLREYTRRARLEADYYDQARRANRTPASEFWSDVLRRSVSGIIVGSVTESGKTFIRSISNYENAFSDLNTRLYGTKDSKTGDNRENK